MQIRLMVGQWKKYLWPGRQQGILPARAQAVRDWGEIPSRAAQSLADRMSGSVSCVMVDSFQISQQSEVRFAKATSGGIQQERAWQMVNGEKLNWLGSFRSFG